MPTLPQHRPRTRLIHAGTRRSPHGETSEAIFLTQGFVYPDAATAERLFDGDNGQDLGYVYSRYANPTVDMFADRLAAYEGAEAGRVFASGMAAVTATFLCQIEAGDHIVAGRELFGSCRYILEDFLPRFGVATTLVESTDLDAWKAAAGNRPKLFFLETPANPTLEVADIASIAGIAHAAGALLVVDNALASPVSQQPLAHGADIVIYSATKHVDGHGRCLGGVVLGREPFISGPLTTYLRHTGATLSPFNAWVFLKALETLELRCHAQAALAARAAEALAGHSALTRMIYPGHSSHPQHPIATRQMQNGGTLLALEFGDGKPAAFRFLDALELVLISNNFGDARSLATHPATTTHSRFTPKLQTQLGISEGLVRISFGLEDPEDVLADLLQAADKAAGI